MPLGGALLTIPSRGGCRYRVILPSPDRSRILVERTRTGCRLPAWHSDVVPYWQVVDGLNAAVLHRFGAVVVTQRCLSNAHDPESDAFERCYEVEVVSGIAAHGIWCSFDELDILSDASEKAYAEQWFRDAADEGSSGEPWFARPHWLQTIEPWVHERLDVERIVQLRTWERSCVLLVRTSGGETYYLKLLPSVFAHEGQLGGYLSSRFGDDVPGVVAQSNEPPAFLTRAMDGSLLAEWDDVQVWADALRRYARMQVASMPLAHDLARLGCPSRPLHRGGDDVSSLLRALETYPGLSAAAIAELRSVVPKLHGGVRESALVPDALEHGDFTAFNIMVSDGAARFFDWSDAAVTHPFLSLASFLDFAPRATVGNGGSWEEPLIDAYLEPWQGHASPRQLRDALETVRTVAPLHRALKYHCDLLPHMHARWQHHWAVSENLAMVLRRYQI